MVIVFVVWVYLFLLSYLIGHGSLFLIRRATGSSADIHFSLISILGMVAMTVISSIISIFYRLNWEVNALFLIVAILYLLIQRKDLLKDVSALFRKLPAVKLLPWFGFATALMVALVYAAMPTKNFDFGLYYMTTIKWISNYAVVPGLGNVHGRLAFNSNWYILSSLFSFSFLKPFSFYDVTPFMYLMMMIYSASGLQRFLQGNQGMIQLLRVGFMLPTVILLAFLDAPATDIAATYFIWLVFIFFLIKVEEKTLHLFDTYAVLIFIFGAFVCTIKLTAIPVMVLPAYLLIKGYRSMKFQGVFMVLMLCMITIAPWVIRNIILSGYLVYPFDKVDIFNVDWKMPIEEVRLESAIVKQYGKYPDLPITQEAVDYSLTLADDPIMSWFPKWFMYRSHLVRLALIMIPLGYLILLISLTKNLIINKFKKTDFDFSYILVFALLLFGILFCFFLGPSLRYSFGFILFYNILFFGVVFKRTIVDRNFPRTNAIVGSIIVLSLLLPHYRCYTILAKEIIPNHYLLSPHVFHHGELEAYENNGFEIYAPKEGYFCWDAPLPCDHEKPSGKVHMRTGKIQDGFKFVGEW